MKLALVPSRRHLLVALVWIVPLVLAGSLGSRLGERRLDLSSSIGAFTYDDRDVGGRSSIAILSRDHGHAFALLLGAGFSYPYAAYAIRTSGGDVLSSIDATEFDSIVVQARCRHQRTLRIQAQTVVPGFTDSTRPMTLVPFEVALPLEANWSRQSAPMGSFSIPTWWPALVGAKPGPRPRAFERLNRLDIQNSPDLAIGVPDTVEIREIALVGRSKAPLAVALFCALLVSGMATWRFRPRATPGLVRNGAVAPAATPTDLTSRQNLESGRILAWIASRYHDESINVELAGREVGIHPRRIPTLLKESTGKTFPAQVNAMRMEEAKRLLRSTDRTVSEIAAAVGISNVPHFHRLFKAETGRTPLEWRGGVAQSQDR